MSIARSQVDSAFSVLTRFPFRKQAELPPIFVQIQHFKTVDIQGVRTIIYEFYHLNQVKVFHTLEGAAGGIKLIPVHLWISPS